MLAAQQLTATNPFDAEGSPKSTLLAAVAAVAERLGNTVAVCRKCYIHPAVLNAFEAQDNYARWTAARARRTRHQGLSAEEGALLRFLADQSH